LLALSVKENRNNMEMKGKLIRWNEDRGFGFIKSSDINDDIFIHISELKTMSRRPLVNDVIYFNVVKDKSGKKKAVNAKIEGVSVKPPRDRAPKPKKNTLKPTIFVIVLLIGASLYAYKTYPTWAGQITKAIQNVFSEEDFTGYSCQGKQYCSQMTSCKEARFYLNNCPDVKIDGNNDGVPCETQWCN
jgi:cold shock CspA family protein